MADVGDSTISDLDARIQASREIKREFEGQWLLNSAMFVGKQWMRFDGLRLYEYEPEDPNDPLIVDNRIQPAIRTEIAKLTKTEPQWIGVPKDGTDEEMQAARLRERVHGHYWRVLQGRRKLRRSLQWSRVAAAGFWKTTWDTTLGQPFDVMARQTGENAYENVKLADGRFLTPGRLEQAKLPPEMLDGLTRRTMNTGDVRLEIRTPFEMFPDALASEEGLESCEWIGEETVHSRDRLIKVFGRDKAESLLEDANPAAGVGEARMPNNSFATPRRGAGKYRGIRVREYWSLPNVDHARGRHVIWTPSGTVLIEEDNPYGWLPYVMFAGTPVPGRFWPDCMTTQGVPLQVELNKVRSQIASNAERIGNPPLMRSADSLDEENEWHGLPGEELIFRDTGSPGAVPAFLQTPSLPPYIESQIDRTEAGMREIFRQYEVNTGSVPAGITAAAAISMLQEAGDTVLSPDIDDISDSLLQAGRQVMSLLKMFAPDERVARIAGEDGAWDFQRWRGDKLGYCDLDEVQIGSGVPESRAAKQAAISQLLTLLLQQGQTIDQRDLRRVLRDYQVGGVDQLLATLNADEDQIQDENRRLMAGEGLQNPMPVMGPDGKPYLGINGAPLLAGLPINSYDNDELHIAGHEEKCKGAAFRELAMQPGGDLIQQGFLAHIELHRSRLAERAANTGLAQAQDAGGPPAAPSSNGNGNGIAPNINAGAAGSGQG